MNTAEETLQTLLAELRRAMLSPEGHSRRVTQKDLAGILRCSVDTVSIWIARLEINLCRQQDSPNSHPARFLLESWLYCRARCVTPYGKTKAVAARLALHASTVTRAAKSLSLAPIVLHHPQLRFPIHFWTLAQAKLIAVRTGRLHLLTTNKTLAVRCSSPISASTAHRPRVWRSRHRHTRNFLVTHDDTIS